MSRPPRLLFPQTVTLLTTRVQQGLPFVHTPLMEMILWSALALAQDSHNIKIISFVIMGNHIHIIALVEDPTEVESFMERFKCETAHAVNRLLGRRQVTVWNEGYDSPAILTLEDLIEKMAYVYANPVRAHRTDSIDNYLGVSSWQMFTSGGLSKEVPRIRRPFIQPLPKGVLSPSEHKRKAAHVAELAKETLTFTLTPDAWTVAFPNHMTTEQFNDKVLKRIREIEQEMAAVREKERIFLPTEYQIITQPIDTPYSPTTFGRRMWCICGNIPVRIAFIAFVKQLVLQARDVRLAWAKGDFRLPFPPGLFPPCPPRLANLMPSFLKRAIAGTY
jgi:REP element-mobilizing transposase RayT